MPKVTPEYRQSVREAIEMLRAAEDDLGIITGDNLPAVETVAEVLALVDHAARKYDIDPVVMAEAVLRFAGYRHKSGLREAAATLHAVGYAELASMLLRLARSGSEPLTWKQRMAIKNQELISRPRDIVPSSS